MKQIEQMNITVKQLKDIIGKAESINTQIAKTWYNVMLVPAAFDIETTEEFMYIWTFSIYDTTIIGYTMSDLKQLMYKLRTALGLGKIKDKAAKVLPVFVHNFGNFEWHYIKDELEITDCFIKGTKEDSPALYAVAYNGFLFADSYAISNMSLEKLGKTYTTLQKTHDLDYSVLRNHTDARHLTEKELEYCCLDTLILTQFAEYFFNEYFRKYKKFPLTQNKIVTNIIYAKYDEYVSKMKKAEKEAYLKESTKEFIDQPTYRLVRKYGFRGGFCGSSGQYYKGRVGYGDLDSAYSWAMIHGYYPRGSYRKAPVHAWKQFIKTHCCQMKIHFKKLKAKDEWLLLESKTRLLTTDKVLTNISGKVKYAENIVVSLNEIELDLYKRCYEWESMEVMTLKIAKRGMLPDYVINAVVELYSAKAKLKHAGKENTAEYKRIKTLPSTVFGASAKRVYSSDLDDLCETEWFVKYKNQKLRPQWGVYIASHVRNLIVRLILMLGFDYWLYTDTDSLYYIYNKKTAGLFNLYNTEVRKDNKAFCEKYGYNYDDLCDLGTFDDSSRHNLIIDEFITTSAKSYAYHYTDDEYPKGNYKIVMSGIPNEAVVNAWKKSGLSFAEFFCDQYQHIEFDRKVAHIVHNTSKVINGELMTCKCGVRIETQHISGSIRMVKNKLAFERLQEEISDDRDYNFE